MQDKISLEKNMPYEGSIQRVLTDSFEIREVKRIISGRTLTNKLVYFESDEPVGEFINVKIIKACPYHLMGEAEK
jgi:tRNA A37 methylthiotransferase MiaB